jgi:DNA-binding GntR family transcriptional regulator
VNGDLDPFPADRWPFDVVLERLAARIEQGEFSATGKLPTARELMRHYSVGTGTVKHVWNVLLEKGAVYYVHGRGYFLI